MPHRAMNPTTMAFLGKAAATAVAAGALTLVPRPEAQAGDIGTEDPAHLVNHIVAETLDGLSRIEPTSSARARTAARELVARVLGPHVDFDTIAGRILGDHWQRATPRQRERFIDAYEAFILRRFSGMLLEHSDAEIEFLPARFSRTGHRARVWTQVDTASLPFPMSIGYWLSKRDDQWRLTDIRLQGVSLMDTEAASFARLVENEGFDGMLERLSQSRG